MEARYAKFMKGDKTAFLGSSDYTTYVADAEKAYLDEFAKQKGGTR